VEDTTIFCRTGLDFGPLVSHHVRHLKAAALARSERDGKMVMYELTACGRGILGAIAPEASRT
jgi:DNA-binding transcriptional ArsR family regulator